MFYIGVLTSLSDEAFIGSIAILIVTTNILILKRSTFDNNFCNFTILLLHLQQGRIFWKI